MLLVVCSILLQVPKLDCRRPAGVLAFRQAGCMNLALVLSGFASQSTAHLLSFAGKSHLLSFAGKSLATYLGKAVLAHEPR